MTSNPFHIDAQRYAMHQLQSAEECRREMMRQAARMNMAIPAEMLYNGPSTTAIAPQSQKPQKLDKRLLLL